MKKLKKFAALLLVGVMALALLTACGGGGGPTEEQKVLAQISQEKGVQATNDAELRAIAEGHLNMDRKNLDAKFKVAGYTGAFQFHPNDKAALRGFFAFEPSQSRLTACQLPQRGELLGI